MATRWSGVTHLIGIDIETTGSVIGVHGIVAVGAVVVDMATEGVVQSRRWTANLTGLAWEDRCVEQFWSKHPAVLEEFREAGSLSSQADIGAAVVDWLGEQQALYPKAVIVSDFPLFDIGWLNYAAGLTSRTPLYLKGADNGWQSILDIDAYEEALRDVDAFSGSAINTDDLVKPSHLPEVDAAYMTVRFVRVLHTAFPKLRLRRIYYV